MSATLQEAKLPSLKQKIEAKAKEKVEKAKKATLKTKSTKNNGKKEKK